MQIVITNEDLAKLSVSTRKELFGLTEEMNEGIKKDTEFHNEYQDTERPYDMTTRMTKKFMAGVSDKTKSFLKVFASNSGVGRVDYLLKATGGTTLRDLNGIQAGLTRRLRKLDIEEESEAYLLAWDEDDSKYEGHFYVTEITLKSLQGYFDVP